MRLEGTSGGHFSQPLLRQDLVPQVAQDHFQAAFEPLQGEGGSIEQVLKALVCVGQNLLIQAQL